MARHRGQLSIGFLHQAESDPSVAPAPSSAAAAVCLILREHRAGVGVIERGRWERPGRWPSHAPCTAVVRAAGQDHDGSRGGDQARLEIVISYQPEIFDGMW
jgi:hypothetical protein